MEALLLLGPTGSGKSPLGQWLQQHGLGLRQCWHFDFGAHLRAGTGLEATERALVNDLLSRGALLENAQFQIAEKILRHAARGRESALVLLNGLPRHVGQALALAPMVQVRGVIELRADAATIQSRLAQNSGGDRMGRVDDDLALVEQKLAIFAERTLPLVQHYRRQGARIWSLAVGIQTSAVELAAKLRDLRGWAVDRPGDDL